MLIAEVQAQDFTYANGYDVIGEDIFTHATGTVYYLPGTSGWGATYANLPTMLWNPQVQTNDASFGVRQNSFGFNINGTADIPLVVEASTNLAAQFWFPLQNCTFTNGLPPFQRLSMDGLSEPFLPHPVTVR